MKYPPYIRLFVRDFAFDVQDMNDEQLGAYMRELIRAYKTGKIPSKYEQESAFKELSLTLGNYKSVCERNKINGSRPKTYGSESQASRKRVASQNEATLVNQNHKPEPEPEPDNIPPIVPPKTERKARARKPETGYPDGFEPDLEAVILAGKLGLDVDAEQSNFRNWTLAKGQCYRDWQAAFRNHLEFAARRRKEREQRQTAQGSGTRDVTGAALRAAEILRQRKIQA